MSCFFFVPKIDLLFLFSFFTSGSLFSILNTVGNEINGLQIILAWVVWEEEGAETPFLSFVVNVLSFYKMQRSKEGDSSLLYTFVRGRIDSSGL
jgi:hypothetical protein